MEDDYSPMTLDQVFHWKPEEEQKYDTEVSLKLKAVNLKIDISLNSVVQAFEKARDAANDLAWKTSTASFWVETKVTRILSGIENQIEEAEKRGAPVRSDIIGNQLLKREGFIEIAPEILRQFREEIPARTPAEKILLAAAKRADRLTEKKKQAQQDEQTRHYGANPMFGRF